MENKKIAKKEIDILYKETEIKEKIRKMNIDSKSLKNEETKTNIEKIKTLQGLLESWMIDSERTVVGCEPILKQTFEEKEMYTIKDKLFELIKKM